MVAYTRRLLAGWRDGQTLDILSEMTRLTMEIAAKVLFDAEVADEARDVGEALGLLHEDFVARFNSLWPPLPANWHFRRAVRRLDEIIYRFVRQRRDGGADRPDLLSLLPHARAEDDTRMTDRQLRDEAMTLFLAGHETTAPALAWAWYLLGSHAEAEARLQAEVNTVLAGREPAVEDLPRLRYTEGVALEALRLYPPAYVIGREALRDCELAGYRVPRGTTILMSQWVVHRDGRFFESPDEFRPQRWQRDVCQADCRPSDRLYLGGVASENRRRGALEAGAVVPAAPHFPARRCPMSEHRGVPVPPAPDGSAGADSGPPLGTAGVDAAATALPGDKPADCPPPSPGQPEGGDA
jgi:cytochrome P450